MAVPGKVGDLIGRKRAYVLGLLGYAVGAVTMALAQSLTAVIVFWALVGGLGAALLLPSMQSLIHGDFDGAARTKVYALVGAAAAIAAAVGPLLGGFITTSLSWRVGFILEAVIIAIVLSGIKLVSDVPYTGPRGVDVVGSVLSVVGMGGVVLSILVRRSSHGTSTAPGTPGSPEPGFRESPSTTAGGPLRLAAGRPRRAPTCSDGDPAPCTVRDHYRDLHRGVRRGDPRRREPGLTTAAVLRCPMSGRELLRRDSDTGSDLGWS